MITYTIVTKPVKIMLTALQHTLKHTVTGKDRIFKRGETMWACRVVGRCSEHTMIFDRTSVFVMSLNNPRVKANWKILIYQDNFKGWRTTMAALQTMYLQLNIKIG